MASFCLCSIKDRQMVQLNLKPAGYFGHFEMLLLYWDDGGQWSDKKNEMWLVYVSKYWTECNKYLTFLVHLNRVYCIWEYSILCYFMTRQAKVSYFCFHVLLLYSPSLSFQTVPPPALSWLVPPVSCYLVWRSVYKVWVFVSSWFLISARATLPFLDLFASAYWTLAGKLKLHQLLLSRAFESSLLVSSYNMLYLASIVTSYWTDSGFTLKKKKVFKFTKYLVGSQPLIKSYKLL